MPKNALLLKTGDHVLFDGDSLTGRRGGPCLDTWPYLRLMNWRDTYAERVAEWLFCNRPDLRLSFHHAAVGGSTIRDMLERFERMVAPCKPNWVIFTLGGNDAAQKIPLDEFTAKFTDYCQRIGDLSGGRMLAVSGFKACPHAPEAKVDGYETRQPYHRIMQRVVRRFDGVYADVGTPLQEKAEELYRQAAIHTVYSDGHFNEVANQIMATQVLAALGVLALHE